MAGPRRITFTGLILFLLLAGGLYLSYKYIPIMWTKIRLENLVKEESYLAKRRPAEETVQMIVASADRQLGIQLKNEDVQVDVEADRVRIDVTWRPVISLLFGASFSYAFHAKAETVFY